MESNSASFIDQYHGAYDFTGSCLSTSSDDLVRCMATITDKPVCVCACACEFVCVCVCVCIHSDKRPYWNARETTVIRCEVFV